MCPECEVEQYGERCIDGIVYGYCSSDLCYGVCEYLGMCDCQCHVPKDIE